MGKLAGRVVEDYAGDRGEAVRTLSLILRQLYGEKDNKRRSQFYGPGIVDNGEIKLHSVPSRRVECNASLLRWLQQLRNCYVSPAHLSITACSMQ